MLVVFVFQQKFIFTSLTKILEMSYELHHFQTTLDCVLVYT